MFESRPPTPDGERELVARGPLTLFDGQDLPRLQPVLHRTWAMPMKWTFEVKPLRDVLMRYMRQPDMARSVRWSYVACLARMAE